MCPKRRLADEQKFGASRYGFLDQSPKLIPMNKLLVAALAGGVFAGGLLAPDRWRTTLQGQIDQLSGKPAASTDAPPPAAPSAPTSASADKKQDTPAVPYTEIQRPLRLGKEDKLGFGLGLYASAEGGMVMERNLAALGFKTQYLAVKDDNGQVWQMLIAGEYQDETEAERNLAILADSLNGRISLQIVRIPPPPKGP